jgi:hypothetical protein
MGDVRFAMFDDKRVRENRPDTILSKQHDTYGGHSPDFPLKKFWTLFGCLWCHGQKHVHN